MKKNTKTAKKTSTKTTKTESKKNQRRPGQWIDDLIRAKDQAADVHFETRDGLERSGRITGLRTQTIMVNGRAEELIDEFEINGDEMDCISFKVLAKIEIDW